MLLVLNNQMQKTLGLVTAIGEHQSEAIKSRITLLYTFFLLLMSQIN